MLLCTGMYFAPARFSPRRNIPIRFPAACTLAFFLLPTISTTFSTGWNYRKINFTLFHFSSFIFVLRKTSGHYNDRFQLLLFENMHRPLLQCLPPKITVSYLSDSSNTFSGTLANNGLTETRL